MRIPFLLVATLLGLSACSALPGHVATAPGPVLIAALDLDATGRDLASQTAAPLENGAPGNGLAGLGSGIIYAGGNTFLTLQDRGPNAAPYNPAVDNTASYADRFQTFTMTLTPSSSGLPYTVKAELAATTLLSSPTPLVYGDGHLVGLGSGIPSMNTPSRFFFSGRSDDFDPQKTSANTDNARFDPEGFRLSADGKSVFISDEYGPAIYQFDRQTGERLRSFTLPDKFIAHQLAATGKAENAVLTSGRVANRGMEGLAITPDGKTLVGIMQSALVQDGGFNGGFTRILTVDIATGATHEYAYPLTNLGTADKPKYAGISEIVAVNDHQFLVDDRDNNGRGAGTVAVYKRLYLIDLKGAQDVGGIEGAEALASRAVSKSLFLDIVPVAASAGLPASAIPEKLEGVTFGPDVNLKGRTLHTLWVSSDNDFVDVVDGAPNPNSFYVFAFSDADLPGYVVQAIAH